MALVTWSSIRSWFRSSASAPRAGRGAPRRLRLEPLEDRTLLSPGDLDPTFGNGGLVTTPFPGYPGQPTHVAVQPDGRLVVAGEAGPNIHWGIALTRYNPNGRLDTSFGTSGLVNTLLTDTANQAHIDTVLLQPDGRILAIGLDIVAPQTTHPSYRGLLARYNSDGSVDGSFGTGGLVTTSFPGFVGANPYGLAVQADGRIVVVGTAFLFFSSRASRFATARYDSDGSLDGSFGTHGLVTTFVSFSSVAFGVAVQADGRIVVVGTTNDDLPPRSRFAVARYEGDALVATHFDVSAPATVTAGQPFDVTVTARDDNGNVDNHYTGTVTLSSTDPLAGLLGSHTFVAADLGVFTFSAVQLFTAGPQSLFAGDGSLGGQADLVVLPGEAVQILLSASDEVLAGVTAGTSFTVTLTAYDAYGNVATGYRGVVSFVSNDPNAVLPTDYQFNSADAGSHDFTITLGTPGPVRLTAIDTDSLMLSYLDLNVN